MTLSGCASRTSIATASLIWSSDIIGCFLCAPGGRQEPELPVNGLRGPAFDFATSARKAAFDSSSSLNSESSSPGSSGWMVTKRSPGNSTTSACPESAHSHSVPSGSASRRLNGMVLIPMELLTPDNQFVAHLASNDEKDDLALFHIIQDPQRAHT